MKAEFEAMINVPGIKDLFAWLKSTDYFKAPAACKFHNNWEGGLYDHSLRVTHNILKLSKALGWNWERPESPYIIGMFHDLCKVNFYKVAYKNAKNEETGQWEKQPYYTVEDQDPLGHGEKSIFILHRYIRLTDEELYSILFHMGAFGLNKEQEMRLSDAVKKHPEILLVQMADHMASVVETGGPNYEVLKDGESSES